MQQSHGKLSVEEVRSSVVHWKGINKDFMSPLVRIFTRSAIDQLASELDESAEILIKSTSNQKDTLVKMIQEERRLVF